MKVESNIQTRKIDYKAKYPDHCSSARTVYLVPNYGPIKSNQFLENFTSSNQLNRTVFLSKTYYKIASCDYEQLLSYELRCGPRSAVGRAPDS